MGELLTVDTSSIADEDGLTNPTFSYDCLADDGPATIGDLARIITTESVYRIRPDDVGLAIKVRVGFTDDAGNVEVLSSATTATVVASEPAPPEQFTATPGDPGELDLEWEAPSSDPTTGGLRTSTVGDGGSPITGYTVQWREDTGSWSNPADVSEAVVTTGMTDTISGLDDTLYYYVRVIATNAVGDGEPSAEATATSGDQPPVVVGPTVSPGGGGGPNGPTPSDVDFEWNVTHDIGALDGGHDSPTGAWSGGSVLWLARERLGRRRRRLRLRPRDRGARRGARVRAPRDEPRPARPLGRRRDGVGRGQRPGSPLRLRPRDE